jgi:hypothetical protein
MSTSTEHESPAVEETDGGSASTFERLEHLLEEWRARIDELLVQADLASKDVADLVRSQAAVAENAYLAARNRLKEMPRDAGANLGSLRSGFDNLVGDMRSAYDSAEAAIRRGSSD